MTFKKNKISLGVALATVTMAGALVSPQALATNSAERTAQAANRKAEMLEAQLQAMQGEIAALRAQVNATAPTTAVDSQKVQELDAWMTSVKSEPVKAKTKDNMVFFRGGYARQDTAKRWYAGSNLCSRSWHKSERCISRANKRQGCLVFRCRL